MMLSSMHSVIIIHTLLENTWSLQYNEHCCWLSLYLTELRFSKFIAFYFSPLGFLPYGPVLCKSNLSLRLPIFPRACFVWSFLFFLILFPPLLLFLDAVLKILDAFCFFFFSPFFCDVSSDASSIPILCCAFPLLSCSSVSSPTKEHFFLFVLQFSSSPCAALCSDSIPLCLPPLHIPVVPGSPCTLLSPGSQLQYFQLMLLFPLLSPCFSERCSARLLCLINWLQGAS